MNDKMCSKSYGDREDDYSGLCPKKQKHNVRRKIPRRGPGVAELEKIRLEYQHISTVTPLPPPKETEPANGPVNPFSSYFTTGSFPDDLIPPVPIFHMTNDSSLHYLPPMNLHNSESGSFYRFMEPSSDNKKIVPAKRPHHFMEETNVGPTKTVARRSYDLSLNNKPFYCFLPSSEQSIRDQDRSFGFKTSRYDVDTDHGGIDLRLKL